jgi:hypothetical protein
VDTLGTLDAPDSTSGDTHDVGPFSDPLEAGDLASAKPLAAGVIEIGTGPKGEEVADAL